MRTLILLICAALGLAALFWDGPEKRTPPGILVPEEPEQANIERATAWPYKGAKVTPLAEFRMRGRVLLTNHYYMGKEATVSPVDLTLGWRLMSNQEVLDQLRLEKLPRAYSWSWRNNKFPARVADIVEHSANMHMVPATDEIAKRLESIVQANVVSLRGYLVQINFSDGGVWRSSLTRKDSGNGACELVWVEDLKVQ